MEVRKVQLTGGSTFTVSLPKEWASDVDLDTGDSLQLFPRDHTLVVRPTDTVTEDWSRTVEVDGAAEADVRRTIRALYTAGFDRVTLSTAGGVDDYRADVSAATRGFIGLETLEAGDAEITLRSLLDPGTVSVEQSTVQLEQVALSMHEDAVRALVERDTDLAEQVIERDREVDRSYAMISRHFNRSLVSPRETARLDLEQAELYQYQTTARQLERVADHAEKIATVATELEAPPPGDLVDEIETAARQSRAVVEQAASTIIGDAAIDTAHEALDDRDDLTDDLEALQRALHERDVAESHLVALTLDSLTRTAEYGGNIAETALQAAARERRL